MTTAMARARLTDGIEVIFDQDSRASFQEDAPRGSIIVVGRRRSRSRSTGRLSSGSGAIKHRSSRRAAHHRRHHRSSSSSSSSSSTSSSRADRPRSRSHPRCHRPADRCRCDDHGSRYSRRHGGGGGHRRRSPPRHYRSRSRSYSPSTRRSDSQKRHQHRHSSSSSSRRLVGRYSSAVKTPSPSRSSRSGSRSSGRSVVSLSVDAKRELLSIAAANAVKILGVDKLELPESVRPILEDSRDSTRSFTPEPEPEQAEERVRPEAVHERTRSQSIDESDEEDDVSPRMSPKRRIISFSIHNSVAKPTVAPNRPKVTSRMDIMDAGTRKPYGHWVQARSTTGKSSLSSASHTSLTTSR